MKTLFAILATLGLLAAVIGGIESLIAGIWFGMIAMFFLVCLVIVHIAHLRQSLERQTKVYMQMNAQLKALRQQQAQRR